MADTNELPTECSHCHEAVDPVLTPGFLILEAARTLEGNGAALFTNRFFCDECIKEHTLHDLLECSFNLNAMFSAAMSRLDELGVDHGSFTEDELALDLEEEINALEVHANGGNMRERILRAAREHGFTPDQITELVLYIGNEIEAYVPDPEVLATYDRKQWAQSIHEAGLALLAKLDARIAEMVNSNG